MRLRTISSPPPKPNYSPGCRYGFTGSSRQMPGRSCMAQWRRPSIKFLTPVLYPRQANGILATSSGCALRHTAALTLSLATTQPALPSASQARARPLLFVPRHASDIVSPEFAHRCPSPRHDSSYWYHFAPNSLTGPCKGILGTDFSETNGTDISPARCVTRIARGARPETPYHG